ncbi:MAG: sulfatase-like hydrolase/transferase [Verrucomicrobiales bacterium]
MKRLILWGCLLFSTFTSLGAEEKADAKPNFLLIFADDLGFEGLGSYGGVSFETPHLDKLAAESLRFERCYTSPVCTPSRMTLYTGTYVTTHRYDYVLPVHQGTKKKVDFKNTWMTYAQVLREAGYATSVTGKWQLATLEFHPEHIREAGFDSWCVWQIWRDGEKTTRYWNPTFNEDGQVRGDIAERFGPDVLADYVEQQMKESVAAGKPFFIHHNMLLPHTPIIQTPDDKAAGREASLPGMVNYMDKIVGRLVKAVDELGVAENTYIIFMGDNGTEPAGFGNRELADGTVIKGGKRDLSEAGTHIPLIVRRPGTIKAGVAADFIDMADWFPTFCELAGVTVPENEQVDGSSFAPRLLAGKKQAREWVSGGITGKVSVYDGEERVTSRAKRKEPLSEKSLESKAGRALQQLLEKE